uniref:DnaJ homolog subfamily C member 2 n=1 Tax=Triatoma dimidiata TaxID=72491 RepID=A0A0V0G6V0_TRIDM
MVEVKNELSSCFIYKYSSIECVGPYFVQYVTNLNQDVNGCSEECESLEQIDESFVIDENDEIYLRSLDPKEWKKQDHYAVLGLEHLRYKASAALIKSAYRQKVLKHHPDKRKAKGEVVNRDHDYFTCITKAWEILGDKSKRRSYDSVDPQFEDSLPSSSDIIKHDFHKLFSEYFERNSRWTDKRPVPQLGGPDDTRDKVDKFYKFWYDFESWREYSYEDEEAKESGQDREERRWIEKQNRAVRAKRKKEEMCRIRNLVDLAYNADPRIVKFKQEDREKKEALKRAKAEAAKARQEELERIAKEEEERARREKEEAEALEKAKQKALKAEREAHKRALKRERKALRDECKEHGYYVENQNDLVKHMEFTEKLCEMLSAKELEEFNTELRNGGKDIFLAKLDQVEKKLQDERQKMMQTSNRQGNGPGNSKSHSWTQDDINLLIKAVNLFPAGTSQRWEVVANFMKQHCKNGHEYNLSPKDVLSKAKELQSCSDEQNARLKLAANKTAYKQLEEQQNKRPGVGESLPEETSQRFLVGEAWTAEEQRLLEQALKTYPTNTQERWDRIAECVKSRTKKECILRYKELAEMVRAKKAAQNIVK